MATASQPIEESLRWYLPILFAYPVAMMLTVAVMRAAGTTPAASVAPIVPAVAMTALFLLAGFGEELGWSGYATEPLRARLGALIAGLPGIAWAGWHFVPLAQAGREPAWIAGWTAFTVAARVLTVWIYDNTGHSVFATALFHASSSVCTVIFAAYFAPTVTGPILAARATTVIALWGPRTLARFRWG